MFEKFPFERTRGTSARIAAVLAAVALAAVTAPAQAANCGNGAGGFDPWLGQFKSKAAAQGISGGALSA